MHLITSLDNKFIHKMRIISWTERYLSPYLPYLNCDTPDAFYIQPTLNFFKHEHNEELLLYSTYTTREVDEVSILISVSQTLLPDPLICATKCDQKTLS